MYPNVVLNPYSEMFTFALVIFLSESLVAGALMGSEHVDAVAVSNVIARGQLVSTLINV